MAEGGKIMEEHTMEDANPPKSDDLKEFFDTLGVKPKTKSKKELHAWMVSYVKQQGLIMNGDTSHSDTEEEVDDGEDIPTQATPMQVNLTRKPWIAKFSGTDKEGYAVWRHQLLSFVQEKHKEHDIRDALRSSLQGKAASVFSRIPAGVTVQGILKKMDSVFGENDSESDLLAEFYGARLMKEESVADRGCRLESILDSVQKQCFLPNPADTMLRNMLWTGLRQDLKDISGYLVKQISNFDDLRIALRRIEKQHKPSPSTTEQKETSGKKTVPARSVQSDKEDSLKKLEALVQQLTADVADMKKYNSNKPNRGNRKPQGNQQSRQSSEHIYGNSGQNNNTRRGGNSNYQYNPARGNTYRNQQQNNQENQDQQQRNEPICWRCGQAGHLQYGCRVNIDHVRRPQDF